jgi:hypothetical protein
MYRKSLRILKLLVASMASQFETSLPHTLGAWFRFAIAALLAIFLPWLVPIGISSWGLALIFGVLALFLLFDPKPRKETVQIDETGVLRVAGAIREQICWNDIVEMRIITNDEGPFCEDTLFVLVGTNNNGCVISNDAAVRTSLLEELQRRFPDLDNEMVIKAMGCTDNNDFLIWKRKD